MSKPQQRGRRTPVMRPIQPAGTDKRYWKFIVTRGGCVMCKEYPLTAAESRGREHEIGTIEGHHILAKRHLRVARMEHRFWDTRNGLALCRLHHHRHEWRMQPVPFRLLPDDALEFAGEVELLYVLENEYPGIEDLR